jgi:hypothetical protein
MLIRCTDTAGVTTRAFLPSMAFWTGTSHFAIEHDADLVLRRGSSFAHSGTRRFCFLIAAGRARILTAGYRRDWLLLMQSEVVGDQGRVRIKPKVGSRILVEFVEGNDVFQNPPPWGNSTR